VPDDAAAARLYQKGCNLGSDAGCANLARLHEKGQGVARSDARALALYTKACEHRYASACTGLGSIYRDGRGVPRDRERAAQLFERACDGNDATGCRDLGVCAATGDGMAQDVTRAATLFQAACDHGDLVGCARLGDALLRGAGVPADRPKGIALLHKACDAGVKLGCARLPVERAHVDAPVVEPVVTKEPRSLPLVYTGAVIGSAGLITAIGALFVMAADHTCEIATSCSLAQNDAEISKSRAEIIALGAGGGALLVGGIMTWVGATKVPVTKPSEPPTASLQPVVTPRILGLTGTF
jgi:TPR repeat protein